MNPHTTHQLIMVRPARFGYNEQTGSTNAFQSREFRVGQDLNGAAPYSAQSENFGMATTNEEQIQLRALFEFDQSVARLRDAGVHITVWDDHPYPPKPDAVFLNNWFSTHPNGEYFLYPMMAVNRRSEIDPIHIAALEGMGLRLGMDLRNYTSSKQFLEGTGSLVFDHKYRVVFATGSPRTHQTPAEFLAQHLGYRLQFIGAKDEQGAPPYHTNVVLSVGPTLAVACLDSVENRDTANCIRTQLSLDHRMLIEVTQKQMGAYCANVLEVQNKFGAPLLVVSRTAWHAFTLQQRAQINSVIKPILLDIPLIEHIGGGSARCLISELYGAVASP